jgi:hypothetical protein
MKGYRTIAVGLALAIAPAALQYLGAVDWSQYVGPVGASAISGVLMIVLRLVTTGPIGDR